MMIWKVEVKNRDDDSSSISISLKMIHAKRIDGLTRSYITKSSKGLILLILRSISTREDN